LPAGRYAAMGILHMRERRGEKDKERIGSQCGKMGWKVPKRETGVKRISIISESVHGRNVVGEGLKGVDKGAPETWHALH